MWGHQLLLQNSLQNFNILSYRFTRYLQIIKIYPPHPQWKLKIVQVFCWFIPFLIRSESYGLFESVFRITFKISLLYALQTWTHFHKFLEEIIFVVDNLKLFLFQNTLQSRTKKSPGNIFFQIQILSMYVRVLGFLMKRPKQVLKTIWLQYF